MYKHGVYSEKENSTFSSLTQIGTVPCYIGDLPIQRMNKNGSADFDYSAYINKPMLINSYNDIKDLYSDDWDSYTLCEAISAHFLNGNEVQAPIILINIFDPAKSVSAKPVTEKIQLISENTKKVGYINNQKAIIDGIAFTVEGGTPVIGKEDFTIEYEKERCKIIFSVESMEEINSVNATYKVASGEKRSELFQAGLDALDHCELITGYIPNILAAPGLSEIPEIHEMMMDKVSSKISDKWNLIAVTDIPSDTNKTIDAAKQWKKTNGYTSKLEKVCYPKIVYNNKMYHLSTILSFTMQSVDGSYDGVPFVSPSNKIIYADGVVLDDGTPMYLSETQANSLNEDGITTVNIIRRQLRSWGSHMGNYNFESIDNIAAEDRGDANVRMMLYLMNYLQYNFIDAIDTPFTRKDVDSVINSVQQWLNSLVNEGKLLLGTISFNESENSTNSMINGDFVFNVANTLTPNAKSLTFKIQYTADGLSLLTGGAE